MNYLLIPGNPPAVHFYELWKSEIEARQPGARVRVSPYPQLAASEDSAASLREVAEAHAQTLRAFAEESGGPVNVIGHSLGGYFALRLLEAYDPLVNKAFLVHPFLRTPTPRGLAVLRLMQTLHRRRRLQDFLVGARGVLERINGSLAFVSPAELRNTFHLAYHEYRHIGSDRSPLHIRPELRPKVRFFYTPRDSWCAPHVVAALRAQVATRECVEAHDFVVRAPDRAGIFAAVLES